MKCQVKYTFDQFVISSVILYMYIVQYIHYLKVPVNLFD